jgi:hypothetical protein
VRQILSGLHLPVFPSCLPSLSELIILHPVTKVNTLNAILRINFYALSGGFIHYLCICHFL